MLRTSCQILAVLCAFFVSNGAQASSLVQQVAHICIAQNAAPSYIASDPNTLAEYCGCEAKIWNKYGSERELRLAMTFMTDDLSHMKGGAYNYDQALDFIVQHSGIVSTACEPE